MKVETCVTVSKEDIVGQKFSSIPQEKYVEFFNKKIIPLLKLPRKVKVTSLTIYISSTACGNSIGTHVSYFLYGDEDINYFLFEKNLPYDIYFELEGLDSSYSTILLEKKGYKEELDASWIEFLKDNLGIDVYKRLLARQRKTDLKSTNSLVALQERRVQRLNEDLQRLNKDLQKEKAELKKRKQMRQEQEEKFKTDFADVLDENGDIVGL